MPLPGAPHQNHVPSDVPSVAFSPDSTRLAIPFRNWVRVMAIGEAFG
jgi:hypothetical protein